jgi:FtsH-binding integral membrane protein
MSKDAEKIKRWPFYIFMFPVFFVLHGYAENFRFISPLSALLLCFTYSGSALLITFFFYLLYKNLSKAALMSFFILAFHFFFGNMLDLLKEISPSGFVAKYSFLVPVFLITALWLFFIIQKRKTLFRITYYLNILFAVLICIDAVLLTTQILNKDNTRYKNTSTEFIFCDSCSKPDVYIIMLDEYAGSQELKDIFNYDNQPFIDSLALRGFKTMSNSHSNYNYTPYSTASTLNMEYMDLPKIKNVKKGFKYAVNKIDNNRTVNFFLSNGYRFFNYSPFTVAGQSSAIEGSFVPANTKLITAGTFLSRLEKDVLINAANKMNLTWYLKKVMYVTLKDNNKHYTLTKKIAETKTGPKIVYTHLLMPHYPYYYNATGELRTFDALRVSSPDNKEDYLSYLKYTNQQMIVLADHILSRSSRPPVIVLISDHGYRQYKDQDIKYYFSNLMSVYLPGRNYSLYNDSTSNVNLFRVLLNTEFRQRLPLLEHKTFLIDF